MDKQVEDQSPQFISSISQEKQLLCHEKREGGEDTEWEWKRGVKACPAHKTRRTWKRGRELEEDDAIQGNQNMFPSPQDQQRKTTFFHSAKRKKLQKRVTDNVVKEETEQIRMVLYLCFMIYQNLKDMVLTDVKTCPLLKFQICVTYSSHQSLSSFYPLQSHVVVVKK